MGKFKSSTSNPWISCEETIRTTSSEKLLVWTPTFNNMCRHSQGGIKVHYQSQQNPRPLSLQTTKRASAPIQSVFRNWRASTSIYKSALRLSSLLDKQRPTNSMKVENRNAKAPKERNEDKIWGLSWAFKEGLSSTTKNKAQRAQSGRTKYRKNSSRQSHSVP